MRESIPKQLTAEQRRIVSFPRDGGQALFVEGLAGTGKSTALAARLRALVTEGRRPYEMLVLVPQRAQGRRYEQALALADGPTRGGVDVVTFYGLSRRAVDLFWPLIAREAGFAHPDREPVFLTIETAQYFMWRIVEPLMRQEGYFSELAIRRGRLLSQLIDNLNKSALVGFDHTEIYARLKAAWTGSQERLLHYMHAQDCATRFRQYCLAHNLLDFSLICEVFSRHLRGHPVYRRYFSGRYRHVLVDNVEENVPIAHQFLRWAVPQVRSTVIAYDRGGGYRLFLGADPLGGHELAETCQERQSLERLFVVNKDCLALSNEIQRQLRLEPGAPQVEGKPGRAILGGGVGLHARYWIGMIQAVVAQVVELVNGGTSPEEIAIVAPYVSEVMRFAIEDALQREGIQLRLLRPATTLRDEPVTRGLLILSILAHDDWDVLIQGVSYTAPVEDVALALQVALGQLDPVRARRLAEVAVPPGEGHLVALDGSRAPGGRRASRVWEYVGYQYRERYETLRSWLDAYRESESEPLDVLLSRLFGELLSHPGYGFHDDAEHARAYGRLVESASKFRQAVGYDRDLSDARVAQEYVQLILGGIASAEYEADWWERQPDEAVLLAPAYAYVTRDLRSSYQFWIDLGSDGWWNRPNQPLTHPYVLSAHWPVGRPWRDLEEMQARREMLGRLVQGLASRCSGGIYLAFNELGIDGSEQGGRLQRVLLTILAEMRRRG